MKSLVYLIAFIALALCPGLVRAKNSITVEQRLKYYGPVVEDRIRPYFERVNAPYPPQKLLYVVFKKERRLKVFAPDKHGDWIFVAQYPLAKLSGKAGPKLKEGDKQIPEGIYRITHLNPVSKFWLSLGVDYPNAFDRRKAKAEGRKNLGGDIMIHGYWYSTGCVAVGNAAVEDLFILAAHTKPLNVKIIIAPQDLRLAHPPLTKPSWVSELYASIKKELDVIGDQGASSSTCLIYYPDAYDPIETAEEFLRKLFLFIVKITSQKYKMFFETGFLETITN